MEKRNLHFLIFLTLFFALLYLVAIPAFKRISHRLNGEAFDFSIRTLLKTKSSGGGVAKRDYFWSILALAITILCTVLLYAILVEFGALP
jgi:hypothetical protein